jgi:hypothetical protein
MDLTIAITEQYQRLVADSTTDMSFAVRSSATAEDLPDASFAGQQETFLNIVGLENIMHAIKEVFASLYNDRAISYRVHKGFLHADVALSAGIQRMVRSDKGAAGVMFTLDTESGFRDAVFVTSSYGLGETVVQGAVNPDEFYVHKPMLAGKKAVVRRNLGSKMIKMTFSPKRSPASPPSPRMSRKTCATSSRSMTKKSWNWPATPDHRKHYGVRWTSSGARTVSTASCTSCRPVRKPCSRKPTPASRKNSS